MLLHINHVFLQIIHKMGGLMLCFVFILSKLAGFHRSLPSNFLSVLHSYCFTTAITIKKVKETKI